MLDQRGRAHGLGEHGQRRIRYRVLFLVGRAALGPVVANRALAGAAGGCPGRRLSGRTLRAGLIDEECGTVCADAAERLGPIALGGAVRPAQTMAATSRMPSTDSITGHDGSSSCSPRQGTPPRIGAPQVRPNRRQTQGVLWDVVAPWVRWPLHSPRRLFTVEIRDAASRP